MEILAEITEQTELREVVRQLGETFNNPQKRESSYFDFYDDSLTIHGFPPNLPANKEGFKQFIYLLWKAFPDAKVIERWNLVDMMLLMEQLKT
jgi:hypothetical protein